MQINLELYKVFHTVAKTGSLTAAAKELYISQPAISKSIMHLEGHLGGRLFNRTQKGMELTYEGSLVYEYINQAYNLIDLAEYKFDMLKQVKLGVVNISASDTVCSGYLLDKIKYFHENYPDIVIKVTNRTSYESISLLKLGKVDIAIVNMPVYDSYIEVENCAEVHDIFVCSSQYYEKMTKPLEYFELTNYPLIALEKLSNTRKIVEEYLSNEGVKINPVIELGSLSVVADFSKIGLGIGLVSREQVQKELDEGILYEVPLVKDLPVRNMGIAKLKDTPLSFAATEFVKLLQNN